MVQTGRSPAKYYSFAEDRRPEMHEILSLSRKGPHPTPTCVTFMLRSDIPVLPPATPARELSSVHIYLSWRDSSLHVAVPDDWTVARFRIEMSRSLPSLGLMTLCRGGLLLHDESPIVSPQGPDSPPAGSLVGSPPESAASLTTLTESCRPEDPFRRTFFLDASSTTPATLLSQMNIDVTTCSSLLGDSELGSLYRTLEESGMHENDTIETRSSLTYPTLFSGCIDGKTTRFADPTTPPGRQLTLWDGPRRSNHLDYLTHGRSVTYLIDDGTSLARLRAQIRRDIEKRCP